MLVLISSVQMPLFSSTYIWYLGNFLIDFNHAKLFSFINTTVTIRFSYMFQIASARFQFSMYSTNKKKIPHVKN